jgi:hypothetical protein
MRRSLLILLAVVIATTALCFGVYTLAGRLCAAHLAHSTDDLEWLRLEFRLADAEIARIRGLHNGYLPKCQVFCDRIAAKKREVAEALGTTGTNLTTDVEQKLAEVAALRAQCQAAMLRHFVEVSLVMPPALGKQYLAEMQRLTLGAHEQIEHRMSGDAPPAHANH